MYFEYECPNCSELVECEYEPDVPPKPCMNPDSPAYSDPGSNGFTDAPDSCSFCSFTFKAEDIERVGRSCFEDYIEAAAEERALQKYDEWMER